MRDLCPRSMVAPFFTREHVDAMRPQIQKIVDFFLGEMIKEGCEKPVDLVEKFSLPIPSRVSRFKVAQGCRMLKCDPAPGFVYRSFMTCLGSLLATMNH